jgi:hypothetical protein
VAITTSSPSFEVSTVDEAFLQVPEGAVQDVESERVTVVEEVGEDSSWNVDLR